MKLDYDCIRELLIVVENKTKLGDDFRFECVPLSEIIAAMPQYSANLISYTALKLEEAEFINVENQASDINNVDLLPDYYYIKDMTFKGHEYLSSVRDKKIWATVKNEISALASVSLPIIQQLGLKALEKQFFN